MINYIRNEDSLIKSGNKLAIEISQQDPSIGFHNKKHLSKKEVEDILNYIDVVKK